MGKIRVKTIGDEGLEEEAKKKSKIKKAEKIARSQSDEKAPDESEPKPVDEKDPVEAPSVQTENTDEPSEAPKKVKKEKFKNKEKARSANYTSKAMQVDKNKTYTINDGIDLLRKVKMTKFDETIELHINTTESGISGTMTLPHGNGKEVRVAIVDDEILAEVEKGKINFDILIAEPSQMPKLAKVARVLGPRGLMPNPKNGTISEKPEEAAKKFKGGQVSYKTESKLPIIHLSVGKMSFEDNMLKENIITVITSIKKGRIKDMTLKSTMSPGIKIQV